MRKIHSFIISLMVIILTGCGSTAATTTASETTLPPKMEEATVAETPAVDIAATSDEKNDDHEEIAVESSATNSSVDESTCMVNGIFCPREYALQLGYELCDSTYHEDLMSIVNNSIKYYISIGEHTCIVCYEKDDQCFLVALSDRTAPHRGQTEDTLIGISEKAKENSLDYLSNLKTLLVTVATAKDIDPNTWSMPGTPLAMNVFDCSAEFKENGFIDTKSLTNLNKELCFSRSNQ